VFASCISNSIDLQTYVESRPSFVQSYRPWHAAERREMKAGVACCFWVALCCRFQLSCIRHNRCKSLSRNKRIAQTLDNDRSPLQ